LTHSLSASVVLFQAALAETIGVKVPTDNPKSDQQLLYRHLHSANLHERLSILPRLVPPPGVSFLWIVHKRFMRGKQFDAEKARQEYGTSAPDTLLGCLGEGPEDVSELDPF